MLGDNQRIGVHKRVKKIEQIMLKLYCAYQKDYHDQRLGPVVFTRIGETLLIRPYRREFPLDPKGPSIFDPRKERPDVVPDDKPETEVPTEPALAPPDGRNTDEQFARLEKDLLLPKKQRKKKTLEALMAEKPNLESENKIDLPDERSAEEKTKAVERELFASTNEKSKEESDSTDRRTLNEQWEEFVKEHFKPLKKKKIELEPTKEDMKKYSHRNFDNLALLQQELLEARERYYEQKKNKTKAPKYRIN